MGLPSLEPIRDEDLPAFCRFLTEHLSAARTPEEWARAFCQDWGVAKPNNGFLLSDQGTDRRRYRRHLCRTHNPRQARAFLQHHELVRARGLPGAEHAAGDGRDHAARLPLHRSHAHRSGIEDAAVPQVQADERAPGGVAQSALAVRPVARRARQSRTPTGSRPFSPRPMPRYFAIIGTSHGSGMSPSAAPAGSVTSSGSPPACEASPAR